MSCLCEERQSMTASEKLDAAMDTFADRLADAFRLRAERQRGVTVARLRKFFGLCQRCGIRPHDGSRIMCTQCWVDTGEVTG